jgi:hypothetical protein
MTKIIEILNQNKKHNSDLVIALSEIIEKNKSSDNLLIAGEKARKTFKLYLEKNHKDVFDSDLKELFKIEPSSLISSNYLAIYKNKLKGSKTIAIKFIDNFIKDYPKCMETTKELSEFY